MLGCERKLPASSTIGIRPHWDQSFVIEDANRQVYNFWPTVRSSLGYDVHTICPVFICLSFATHVHRVSDKTVKIVFVIAL